MSNPIKIRENRLRGMARRQGVLLVKPLRRDPFGAEFGRYYIALPIWPSPPVAGKADGMARMTLDDAEAWLRADPTTREDGRRAAAA
jgi:hypothetical protein